jgi:hypothetical protein
MRIWKDETRTMTIPTERLHHCTRALVLSTVPRCLRSRWKWNIWSFSSCASLAWMRFVAARMSTTAVLASTSDPVSHAACRASNASFSALACGSFGSEMSRSNVITFAVHLAILLSKQKA